jgi:hypothetical protein
VPDGEVPRDFFGDLAIFLLGKNRTESRTHLCHNYGVGHVRRYKVFRVTRPGWNTHETPFRLPELR